MKLILRTDEEDKKSKYYWLYVYHLKKHTKIVEIIMNEHLRMISDELNAIFKGNI